jgi:hypothetical protein
MREKDRRQGYGTDKGDIIVVRDEGMKITKETFLCCTTKGVFQ